MTDCWDAVCMPIRCPSWAAVPYSDVEEACWGEAVQRTVCWLQATDMVCSAWLQCIAQEHEGHVLSAVQNVLTHC